VNLRGRAFVLAVAAQLIACSAVLDIYSLPEDAGPDVTDATRPDAMDATKPDAMDATARHDAGSDSALDAAHEASVPCKAACVDGGVLTCSDAGARVFMTCSGDTFCSADGGVGCREGWPFGAQSCHVAAGQTWGVRVGSVVDCTSLVIDDGGVLELVPPDQWDGGGGNLVEAWTIIGVADAAVINGTITGQWVGNGQPLTVTGAAPGPGGQDGGGEPLSYTFPHTTQGGAGGTGGFACYPPFQAPGGRPSNGNGGGGGGGATGESAGNSAFCGFPVCIQAVTQLPTGFGPGLEGGVAAPLVGGTGGTGKSTDQAQTTSHPGPTAGGAGGTAAEPGGGSGGSTGAGGGGGGFRGATGGLLYLRVRGHLSGSGSVVLAGATGGTGGAGGTFVGGVYEDLEGTNCTEGGYAFASGGGGGGGGAGGAGGAFFLRYEADGGAVPLHVSVAGGAGGAGGGSVPSTGQGGSGEAGAPGLFDVGGP
jgi:hypothetical protein